MIEEAEKCLWSAARAERVGRFQLEAAIQSAHAQRARTGATDWESIALLYEGLVHRAPTIGALVGRAAAVAQARGESTGWHLLQAIPANATANYQPYWALIAHLLAAMHCDAEARAANRRAIELCRDPAMRQWLEART